VVLKLLFCLTIDQFYSFLFIRTGKYPSRAASSRRTNTNDNEDIGKVTIPTTKLQDVRTQPNKDCTEENLAVTFQKEGYRTGMIGKWHLSRFRSYTYSGAQETVQGCGFDYVEALYVENLASEGGFNSYSDGSFSHNMEWVTAEAITFINESSSTVSTISMCYFLLMILRQII
jgi:arylsulfatase A-like enzyme